MNDAQVELILEMDRKERFLTQLIAWLKGKGLWEEAMKDLDVTPKSAE
jgi:hypothetical protein